MLKYLTIYIIYSGKIQIIQVLKINIPQHGININSRIINIRIYILTFNIVKFLISKDISTIFEEQLKYCEKSLRQLFLGKNFQPTYLKNIFFIQWYKQNFSNKM